MWKQIRRNYRRLIAFMLTVAMVATNVGGNLGTVFAAGESENALFLVPGGWGRTTKGHPGSRRAGGSV